MLLQLGAEIDTVVQSAKESIQAQIASSREHHISREAKMLDGLKSGFEAKLIQIDGNLQDTFKELHERLRQHDATGEFFPEV